jgi:hypothetical protein
MVLCAKHTRRCWRSAPGEDRRRRGTCPDPTGAAPVRVGGIAPSTAADAAESRHGPGRVPRRSTARAADSPHRRTPGPVVRAAERSAGAVQEVTVAQLLPLGGGAGSPSRMALSKEAANIWSPSRPITPATIHWRIGTAAGRRRSAALTRLTMVPFSGSMSLVNSRGNAGDRFRDDPLLWVEHFADEVLVRCPACGECAIVLDQLGTSEYHANRDDTRLVARRRLRCLACGLSKDGFPSERVFGVPVDPYFRLPVWLQADCCGKVLWAYNAEHLSLLESYVAARLRERRASPGSMTMVARLPAWLKSAKHRDEILRAIRRLRSSLPTAQQ